MSLRLKLIIVCLAIATIPLFFVSALTLHNYTTSLENARLTQMQNLAAFKADEIETYFADLKIYFEFSQIAYVVKTYLPVLTQFANDPDRPEFTAAKKMIDAVYLNLPPRLGMLDFMLTDTQGRIVYSNNPQNFSDVFLKPLPDQHQKAFEEGKNKIYLTDIFFDKSQNNRPTMLIAGPAHDYNGQFIGVIAAHVAMTSVYDLIQDTTGLGKTGEILIGKKVGDQVLFLNPLRHDPNTALVRTRKIGDKTGIGMQNAVQGTGFGQYIDYRGVEVVGAWRYIPSLDWGMVANIDAVEAFAEIAKLRKLAIIIMVIVIVLSGITAFSIARSISEPIRKFSEGAAIIGSGNLDYKIASPLKDEIGQLSQAFDKMTGDLKQTLASRDELNREITERKQVEEALRQSEIKYRTVADNTYDWEFWLDPEGRFIYCSPSCQQITGRTPEDFLADSGLRASLVHPDDRAQFEKHVCAIERKQKEVSTGEWRYMRPDGTCCWIAHVCQPVYDDAGRFIGTRGNNRDITERKAAEEVLRRSEGRWNAAIENLDEGVIIATENEEIIYWNPAARAMHGMATAGEGIGPLVETADTFQLWTLDGSRMLTFEEWPVRRIKRGQRVRHLELRLRRPDQGWEKYVLYSGAMIDTAGGEHLIFLSAYDLTELRKAEEALRQSNDELNRFNRAAVGRELRMIELKKEVNSLFELAGKPPRYALEFEKESNHEKSRNRIT